MPTTTQPETPAAPQQYTPDQIRSALALAGLDFTDDEITQMLAGDPPESPPYGTLRSVRLENSIPPAIRFDPTVAGAGAVAQATQGLRHATGQREPIGCPDNVEEMAFCTVEELGYFLKTQQVTSLALTEMYLDRLKTFGPKLECVITLTEDLAMDQAQRADAEIAAGDYRGPLHGIPWGAKDLLAVKGYPTTWGAAPYKKQTLDMNAAVVQKLEAAGAVLVAKLSMGALAWGDVWFGGKTRSPWNLEEGSSGSSAGSGAATAAGLVGFAIGTETHGSIISPSTNCGLSGLRPTFGRVSRAGAMALSWSMDKIGPMCRSVGDCGLVFDAIRAQNQAEDQADPTSIYKPFRWPIEADLSKLKIGYLKEAFEADYEFKTQDTQSLATLRELGAELIPMELPNLPIQPLNLILSAEAAAAFDELTRSNQDDLLVRQVENAWPNRLRQARLTPAVEYIQANRVRTLLCQQMAELMTKIDCYVAPSSSSNLLLTNLTGHPAVCIPNGFRENGLPTTITITGRLYDESTVLAVAQVLQDATEFHTLRPVID